MSSGDLLRAEVQSGSERGKHLNELMQKGLLVSDQLILDMIKDAMVAKSQTSKGFLIDGYPRKVDQGLEFEKQVRQVIHAHFKTFQTCEYFLKTFLCFLKQIAPCRLVLYIDVSDETMKKRLLFRGQSSGRVDDNEETIKQRLQTFHQLTEPVIEHYAKQSKLKSINAERAPDVVFEDVKAILDTF